MWSGEVRVRVKEEAGAFDRSGNWRLKLTGDAALT